MEYSERSLLGLPLGENDRFERKGSRLLDRSTGNEGKIRDELSKQISAFANTGGGDIIYGLDDRGEVDEGGIRVDHNGVSTRAWLEDLLWTATDEPVPGCEIFEVSAGTRHSTIREGRAVYVVHVPDSPKAPHQSARDLRYYIRVQGKSRPAPHRIIEDIRNRARHPVLALDLVSVQRPALPPSFPLGGHVRVHIRTRIRNLGRLAAQAVCISTQPSPGVGISLDPQGYRWRQADGAVAFWECDGAIHPGMAVAQHFSVEFNLEARGEGGALAWYLRNASLRLRDVRLEFRLFADSAPPVELAVVLGGHGLDESLSAEAAARSDRSIIKAKYGLSGDWS